MDLIILSVPKAIYEADWNVTVAAATAPAAAAAAAPCCCCCCYCCKLPMHATNKI